MANLRKMLQDDPESDLYDPNAPHPATAATSTSFAGLAPDQRPMMGPQLRSARQPDPAMDPTQRARMMQMMAGNIMNAIRGFSGKKRF